MPHVDTRTGWTYVFPDEFPMFLMPGRGNEREGRIDI